MALQPLVTVGGGASILYADVVSGTVVGFRLDVPAGKEATVEYVNGSTTLIAGTYPAGQHTATLAKNKQFTLATATGTRVTLTMRWPD